MIQFTRALTLVALLGLVLTSAAAPASTQASTANARQSSSVSENCCSPSHVARAAARLPAHPLPAGYYSPLVLISPLPQRRLTFIVESNIPRRRLYLLGQLLLTKARATVTNNLGPSHPGAHSPWSIKRVLTVQGVANLCSHHAASRFTASVRGYLAIGSINRLGGGFVGRLFTEPNPHAFFASDTKPFVQVWETKAWHPLPSGRHVTFHGILSCDISGYGASLPGWLGSIKPDRYTTG